MLGALLVCSGVHKLEKLWYGQGLCNWLLGWSLARSFPVQDCPTWAFWVEGF